MKTKELYGYPRVKASAAKGSRRAVGGPGFGTALLGVICAAGVLGVLTLLYHFG